MRRGEPAPSLRPGSTGLAPWGHRHAQRYWAVNGLGDHSEVHSETRQTWVKASKQVLRPAGLSRRPATPRAVSELRSE